MKQFETDVLLNMLQMTTVLNFCEQFYSSKMKVLLDVSFKIPTHNHSFKYLPKNTKRALFFVLFASGSAPKSPLITSWLSVRGLGRFSPDGWYTPSA